MATQPEDVEDVELEHDEAADEAAQGEAQPQGDDEELVVEIEGEDGADDTPVIRQLRDRLRDTQRELHEERSGKNKLPAELGAKPTLEGCDYDEDRFEQQLTAWHDTKRGMEAADRERQQLEQTRNQTFERARGKYQAEAAQKRIKGFAEAEAAVLDALGPEMLGAIIQYSNKPAELVTAVGSNPRLLAEVQAENDPLRKFRKLWEVEGKVKTNRKAPPPPEAPDNKRGSAPIAHVSGDKKLDQLRSQAEKTGDYSALTKYRSDLKRMGKAA